MAVPTSSSKVGPNDIVRLFLELFAILSLAIWGFLAWAPPLSVLLGIATPLVAAILWGLFRSPKARFRLPPVGRAIIEIVVMAGATVAWLSLGKSHIAALFALLFAVLAIVSGIVNLRAEIARDTRP
jgi:hypothetical protein